MRFLPVCLPRGYASLNAAAQLAKVSLISPKEVRSLLSELANARLLESQEVARSKTDRSRSIFLYYVDPPSWQTILLAETYQALGNLVTRSHEETQRMEGELYRLSRPDIKGDMTQLSEADQKALAGLNMRLEFLKTAMERAGEDLYLLHLPE